MSCLIRMPRTCVVGKNRFGAALLGRRRRIAWRCPEAEAPIPPTVTTRFASSASTAGDDDDDRVLERRPSRKSQSSGMHDTYCADGNAGFIERCKVAGANALLGKFTHYGGYDSALASLKVERVGKGEVEATLPVDKAVQNFYKTLHGGCIATVVDVVGTMAMLSQNAAKPGVSVDLNVSFCAAAKAGDTVRIKGRLLKSGRKLAFTQVDLYRESDGKLVATGRHTKAL